MDYRPGVPQSVQGPMLVKEYGIKGNTSCSTCHGNPHMNDSNDIQVLRAKLQGTEAALTGEASNRSPRPRIQGISPPRVSQNASEWLDPSGAAGS
jgi:hypothetical protein